MSTEPTIAGQYHCPGQVYPISRSVHLGRLARFYPGCRQCPHREDTVGLSARLVRQWAEVRPRAMSRPLFHEEGAGGVYLNEFTPAVAERIAAAFGVCLQSLPLPSREDRGESPACRVVLACDGRPQASNLVAALSEGLRWAGCQVVDIGPATSACLAFAIDHLGAAGGILVGAGQAFQPDVAHVMHVRLESLTYTGLKFYAGPRPLSRGELLDQVECLCQTGIDRPSRTSGPSRRFQADEAYLDELQPHYHALRPLRMVLDCESAPLAGCLRRLTGSVACEILPCRAAPHRLGEQTTAEAAHFAARIEADGEVCRLFDEQGNSVPPERLVLLLARFVGWGQGRDSPCPVVLEDASSPALARRLESLGMRVISSLARRSEMDRTMREHAAVLGGGPSGRIWHRALHLPLPDALRTLTLLLVLLSRSDRPFSAVLDAEAPLD